MSFNIKDGISALVSGTNLTREQSQDIMKEIMSGNSTDPLIAAYLTALRIRGETPEVISGAASVMREFASSIHPACSGRLVDTCGTGGDKSNTFNISTISALVTAGAGANVAKHGNRSVSSKCGSADLLEGLGVNINLTPKEVEKVIEDVGIGFMFAPKFHPAMKYAMPVRRSLAMRTIFNILGPLTNPAGAKAHVLGVFDRDLVNVMAKAMADLGSEHAFIVHSEPGVDELIPVSKTYVGEVSNGEIKNYTLEPKDFGMEKITLDMIKGGDLETNLKITAEILNNVETGVKRDIVLINSAYALMAAGLADNYEDGFEKAKKSIESGKALKKLENFVKNTHGSIEMFNKVING